MPRYAQGQPVRVATEVRDGTGVLVTPGSILLRVRKPDGTFLTDYTSPIADAVGKYHVDIPALDLTALGHYQYAWITTGAAAGVSAPAGFDVTDPFTATHLAWSDVLERLELTTTTLSAARQAELQNFMAAAVSAQEEWVGAVAPRTVTETLTAAGGRLWPGTRPVLSVTSALYGLTPLSTTTWTIAGDRIETSYGWLSGAYSVTYVAGRNPIPADLVEAGLLRVKHLYATQRGGTSGPGRIIGGAVDDIAGGPDGSDFLLKLRAEDLEAPYRLVGIA